MGKKTDDLPFPVRGIAGGWKDFFDEDDRAVIRDQAAVVERDQAMLRKVAEKQRGKEQDLDEPCSPFTPPTR